MGEGERKKSVPETGREFSHRKRGGAQKKQKSWLYIKRGEEGAACFGESSNEASCEGQEIKKKKKKSCLEKKGEALLHYQRKRKALFLLQRGGEERITFHDRRDLRSNSSIFGGGKGRSPAIKEERAVPFYYVWEKGKQDSTSHL